MEITAHSGCDGTPMNSMEFIKHALSLNVDAIEIDIRRNNQGILVLTHDTSIEENLVTLYDAFIEIAKYDVAINCDIKEYNLEQDVVETAIKCGINLERIIFSGSVTTYKKDKWPEFMKEVKVYINAEEIKKDFYYNLENNKLLEENTIRYVLEKCKDYGCNIININFRICNDKFVDLCNEYDIKISAWTVTEEEDIKKISSFNVFNITSRAPLLVRKIIDSCNN